MSKDSAQPTTGQCKVSQEIEVVNARRLGRYRPSNSQSDSMRRGTALGQRSKLNEPKTGFDSHRIHRLALPQAKQTPCQSQRSKMCTTPEIDWNEFTWAAAAILQIVSLGFVSSFALSASTHVAYVGSNFLRIRFLCMQ